MDLSPGWLFASLCVGTIGGGLCLYGKKAARLPHLLAGLALVVESMTVPSAAWMLAAAAGVVVALVGAVRGGF